MFSKDKVKIMEKNPLVSIVIPTLNSESTLEKCLLSIKNQTYQNYEIIIVDGGSEDETIKIAKKYAKFVDFNIPSITKQTNMGISNSNGKYIYRIDSDVILPPMIIEESVMKCEDEGFDGVCIFWIPDESISFWAKVRKFEKEMYIKEPNYVGSIEYDKNVLGARFLKKEVYNSVKGLNEEVSTSGEDYALYNKLAKSDFQFALINSREMHIGEPKTLKDIIKKNFRYGTALMQFFENQEDGKKQFSPIGRGYLIKAFKSALRNNKMLFLGLTTYIFAVYVSTATGIIYYKFTRKTKNLA